MQHSINDQLILPTVLVRAEFAGFIEVATLRRDENDLVHLRIQRHLEGPLASIPDTCMDTRVSDEVAVSELQDLLEDGFRFDLTRTRNA